MSSSLARIMIAVGLLAVVGINVVAPRIGVTPTLHSVSPPPDVDGPRLIPVPAGRR